MRVWANPKILAIYWLSIGSCFYSYCLAGEFSTQIKSANLVSENGWYELEADFTPNLSPVAKKAIQSNVPLVWCLKIQFKQVRYFHDKTLVNVDYRYKIRYHGLLNSYSLTNETTQERKKYASLADVLEALATVRALKVLPLSALKKHKHYKVAIKLEFEKEQLPPPLRPVAYLNSEWNLSSDWYIWELKE